MKYVSFFRHGLVLMTLSTLGHFSVHAQGVGVGTTAPDASAALDIVSSTKGALLPRLALASAITSPATGLIVYQTSGTPGYYYNAGTPAAPNWQQLATVAGTATTASNGLTKTGNNSVLGGTLTGATAVAQAGNAFGFTGGNVGIGNSAPAGLLDVSVPLAIATAAVDQQQLTYNSAAGVYSYYQSFTAGASGQLQQITVYEAVTSSTNGGAAAPAILKLYQGTGTGGTLLASQAYSSPSGSSQGTLVAFATPAMCVAGQVYSFEVSLVSGGSASGTYYQLPICTNNCYAGGGCGTSPASWDVKFQTKVAAVTAAVTGLLVRNDGNVGLGIATPTQKLEVAGQIFSNTGGFRFPDNTVQTSAAATGATGPAGPTGAAGPAGPTGAAGSNATVAASNGMAATTTAGVTTVKLGGSLTGATTIAQAGNAFSLTGGNVGIGTATPAGLFDVVVPGSYAAAVTDQQQLVTNGGSTANSVCFQTFTAGMSGQLQTLVVYGSTSTGTATANIYQGSSTTGALLASQLFTAPTSGSTAQTPVTFATPATVTSGQVYTFQISVSSNGVFSSGGCNSNCYPNGANACGNGSFDVAFQTLVAVLSTPQSALLVNAGQVGIGTTTPTQKLEVAGQIFSNTGGFRFPDNTVQTSATTTGPAGATGPQGATGTIGAPGPAGSNATVTASNGLTATSGNIALGGTLTAATTVAQAGYAFSHTGGNVGIGTATPASKLTVQTAADADQGLRVTDGTTTGNIVIQPLAGSNTGFSVINYNGYYGASGEARYNTAKNRWRIGVDQRASTDMFFIDSYNGTTGFTPLAITAAGNVGIGTISPTQKLDVQGGNIGLDYNYDLYIRDLNHGIGYYGGAKTWNGFAPDGPIVYGYSGGALGTCQSTSGSTTKTPANLAVALAWTSTGKVGIGTTTPTQLLDVNGGILARATGVISNQGAHLQWNRSGGEGETWLINHLGSGTANAGIRFGGVTTNGSTTVTEWARIDNNGNMAINSASANGYRLYINGAVLGTSFTTTSDRRLKTDIRPLTGALALVQALHGHRYRWNAQGVTLGGTAGREQVGVIAQELETVLPELVSTGTNGIKTVNYAQLTPVLIEAIKEQQQQIETLKAQNQALQARTALVEADHASLLTMQAQLACLLGEAAPAVAGALAHH